MTDAERLHDMDALLRRYTAEAEEIGRVFCELHGVHRTDMQALLMIMEADTAGVPLTPVDLARQLGLSTGATSAAVDRLERAGHVRRSRESNDRRRVHLHYTEHGMELGRAFFMPLGKRTAQVRAGYTDQELAVVRRFLSDMAEALREHRIQATGSAE